MPRIAHWQFNLNYKWLHLQSKDSLTSIFITWFVVNEFTSWQESIGDIGNANATHLMKFWTMCKEKNTSLLNPHIFWRLHWFDTSLVVGDMIFTYIHLTQHQQSPIWLNALGVWDPYCRQNYTVALKSCSKKVILESDTFSVKLRHSYNAQCAVPVRHISLHWDDLRTVIFNMSILWSCIYNQLMIEENKKKSHNCRSPPHSTTSSPTSFNSCRPFYQHGLTLIPAWINNHIHYKEWDEITYPFLNFNGVTVEV